jgi:hypothetical protein
MFLFLISFVQGVAIRVINIIEQLYNIIELSLSYNTGI